MDRAGGLDPGEPGDPGDPVDPVSAGPLLSCRSRVRASYSICRASARTSSFWLRPRASRPLQPGSTLSFWVGTADMVLEEPARTHGAHRPIS